jgi:hypothetical protein
MKSKIVRREKTKFRIRNLGVAVKRVGKVLGETAFSELRSSPELSSDELYSTRFIFTVDVQMRKGATEVEAAVFEDLGEDEGPSVELDDLLDQAARITRPAKGRKAKKEVTA